MMRVDEKYDENTRKMMDRLCADEDMLSFFVEALENRAEMIARDMIGVNDINLMFSLKGQISICYELYDRAKAALEAKKAAATAGNANRFPHLPEMEV